MNYVVYSRGLLRYENIDYKMAGSMPIFFKELFDGDIVSIFEYTYGKLSERKDYIVYQALGNETFKVKQTLITNFVY